MKYLIVGTGGTGACIGGFLAKNNHDVTFIARGKHLEAINENGLTINSDRIGKFNLKPVKAMTTEQYLQTNEIPDVIERNVIFRLIFDFLNTSGILL